MEQSRKSRNRFNYMEHLYVINDASQIIGEILNFLINGVKTPRFIDEKVKLDLYFT